jgi:hypothetical protein
MATSGSAGSATAAGRATSVQTFSATRSRPGLPSAVWSSSSTSPRRTSPAERWTGPCSTGSCAAFAAGRAAGSSSTSSTRFARTLVGGLTTLNELTDHRALFASATEPLFDFTTADGRIFLQMNLMMAEYFRERTKESWEASLTHAVGRGVHIAPEVGYGYAKDGSQSPSFPASSGSGYSMSKAIGSSRRARRGAGCWLKTTTAPPARRRYRAPRLRGGGPRRPVIV